MSLSKKKKKKSKKKKGKRAKDFGDNPKVRGPRDANRVSLNEPWEVYYAENSDEILARRRKKRR